MSQDIPPIHMFMSLAPVSVARDQTVAFASSLMNEHRVRHLPVVDALGEVVGILSQRELQLIARRWDLDDTSLSVDVLANHEIFTVPPEAPLDAVCATMAERRYGCAIVVEDKRPVGIFTTTDACAALVSMTQSRVA